MLVPKEEMSPEQIMNFVDGATTRVRTEYHVSAEFAVSVVTPGVSTEPFPVGGNARCQERRIMGATVCR